jgi:hypothetical protein
MWRSSGMRLALDTVPLSATLLLGLAVFFFVVFAPDFRAVFLDFFFFMLVAQ